MPDTRTKYMVHVSVAAVLGPSAAVLGPSARSSDKAATVREMSMCILGVVRRGASCNIVNEKSGVKYAFDS
jgi:hypothetical protein